MPITFTWTDFPETADSCSYFQQHNLSPTFQTSVLKENHILVTGDNYPVLKLLQPELRQKINLIYIDPPYNTGKDFTYSDSFGTSTDSHSAWLSFMKRRLVLARDFLTDDGCIFIAIDQSELYVLKLLCDQIFNEENFVNDFMWLHGKGKKDKWSRTLQQHTLCYAKNKKYLADFSDFEATDWAVKNIDNDPRGNWFSGSISFSEERSNPGHKNYFEITSPSGRKWLRQWQVSREEMDRLLAEKKIYFGTAPKYDSVPRRKIFNSELEEVIPRNIIDGVESTRSAQRHLDRLLGEKGLFDNPKPVDLIEHLIFITQMKKDALIMDFFAGSGTTFEAVCRLNKKDGGNRRCILIQKNENNIADLTFRRCTKVSELFDCSFKNFILT